MKEKLISVIIPTYKQNERLNKSITSVLSQTYKNIEIIVVDDNNPGTESRRNTEIIMDTYKNHSCVRYIKHDKNRNGSAARNTGFRVSKGEYIAFLDDDDFWEKDKLEKQCEYLENHLQYDAVYTYIILSGGRQNPNHCCEGNIVEEYLTNYVSLQTSCLLFTRKAVESIKGFDESFIRHQDYEFILRFFFAGFEMGCIPEYLSYKSAGGENQLTGERLNRLKDKFFETFGEQFNLLDREHPGIKKRIVIANYVKVFESHVAGHHYRLAMGILNKYFLMNPIEFIKQCFVLLKNHIIRHRKVK